MKSLGKFGKYGGVFVPEVLIPALEELEKAYFNIVKKNKNFKRELNELL
ncbi:MAG: tryptophan synthase subunit beta, partial [Candidatus Wildermuthbacteria bacterium]|nr:tryptophan synthase subunit beta [Candidatus Wildermuthbacteria bacterium]